MLGSSDGVPPAALSHLQQVISAVSKPDAPHSTLASPSEAAVHNGAHTAAGSSATDNVRDLDRTGSSGSVMDGVVWVPDKGLSVSVSHDGAAADAETYRERWEQSEAARRTCASITAEPCFVNHAYAALATGMPVPNQSAGLLLCILAPRESSCSNLASKNFTCSLSCARDLCRAKLYWYDQLVC